MEGRKEVAAWERKQEGLQERCLLETVGLLGDLQALPVQSLDPEEVPGWKLPTTTMCQIRTALAQQRGNPDNRSLPSQTYRPLMSLPRLMKWQCFQLQYFP